MINVIKKLELDDEIKKCYSLDQRVNLSSLNCNIEDNKKQKKMDNLY